MWMKGDAGTQVEALLDEAVRAASLTRSVLAEAVREAVEHKLGSNLASADAGQKEDKGKKKDVVMTG